MKNIKDILKERVKLRIKAIGYLKIIIFDKVKKFEIFHKN